MTARGPYAGLPRRVDVVEVGPRDGLQNIETFVPTDVKVELVNRLLRAGFAWVEVTSFVHPAAVAQMSDAEEVMRRIRSSGGGRMVLVPNARGAERALACGPDRLNFVLSASESQNEANLRQSIDRSQRELEETVRMAGSARVPVRLTISTAFGCPFEGAVDPQRVRDIARHGADLGTDEVCLADTTGMANPRQVFELVGRVTEDLSETPVAVHLHNTRGAGAANLVAGLQAGARAFDGAVGGLGGCPFAPGASGNICTEDMVHMLEEMGIETGIDLDAVLETALWLEAAIDRPLAGQVIRAGPAGNAAPPRPTP